MSAAPFYIVVNAVSGKSDTETTCRAITDVLTAAGRVHEILRVEDPARLGEIAAQAVAKAQHDDGIVVAAGGDGTLNAVPRPWVLNGATPSFGC